ncbi:malate:quinone oxidoreductase [Corynebacterium imitans]|uniref:Probable malate:quinone oxidoreductase n=1 Tax=Corynebacterium imitans TaxID=156978 RepID=A0A076NS75_9CORY|nr:malate dehydrogenase (quinone) [Corynebacterium imitans]AIJ33792.1 malate:quinone oxidoreductase [Corynebacterium imitans]MDK8307079.1 malate dehydrogenase (quinone) [Corynebacterium imitans]MDK8638368.1 malate dehydrogenase (quinone) [Corynebacterium imitans]MDK8773566.1 malate dehydrogenase (quinone) [Corynebacterium imitans]SNV75353.1 malate:quinone oxidoreductase [Corynebacterium imitans]
MSDTAANRYDDEVDVLLIGAGIMSATLGAMIRELEPEWSQVIYERLEGPAQESSYALNNAGTGHSALCELNYTPEKNGRIDVNKAMGINEKFQISRQFWSHQIEHDVLGDPSEFINPVPHVSFAQGKDQIDYLRRRYEALSANHMFPNMQFTEDREVFAEKLPLMAKGRDFDAEPVAISWTDAGTDINYGALCNQFFDAAKEAGTDIRYGHEVTNLKREGNFWKVTVRNVHTGDKKVTRARFVFVGAGGYALDLLRKAGVPEVRGYAGFPISGMWLRTTNQELVAQHKAKVYGKAKVGAPPMSVPHLDLRVIDGEESLLFGPYGGWTPKFLKKGSYLDLFKSIRPDNIPSYLGVAATNFGLVKYLVEEVFRDFDGKMDVLHEYYPEADPKDWDVVVAGQRVQVIKPAPAPTFGTLEFGTALVNDQSGSIAGILGASPGASITPSAMLELLERCFGERMIEWRDKLHEMFPTYGKSLKENKEAYDEQWAWTQKTLKLER